MTNCTPKSSVAGGSTSAAAAPSNNAPATNEQFDAREAITREASGLKEVKLSGATWTATALTLGNVKTEMAADRLAVIEIPIAEQHPISCSVVNRRLSVGATLGSILHTLREANNIEYRLLRPWKLSVQRESPVVFLDVVYTASANEKIVGRTKIAIQDDVTNPIICTHDDLGYLQTFERVSEKLMSSFTLKQPRRRSTFVEVVEYKVGDMPIGFDRVEITNEASGMRKVQSVSTKFAPQSEVDLLLEDELSVVSINGVGELTTGQWWRWAAGQAALQVELKKTAKQAYTYQGEIQNKPVSGQFRTQDPEGLANLASTSKRLREKLTKRAPFSFRQLEYFPTLDVSAPVDVRYWREQKDPGNVVHCALRDGELVGTVDAKGRFEQIKFDSNLLVTRIFTRGTP